MKPTDSFDRQNRFSVGVHRSRGKSNFVTKSGATKYQNTGIGRINSQEPCDVQPCAWVGWLNIPPFGRTFTVIAIILMTRMFKAEAQKRKRKVRRSKESLE